MKQIPLAVVFIPSLEIQSKYPDLLEKFGEREDTCVYAIRYHQGTYAPAGGPADVVLITDRSPNERIRLGLQPLLDGCTQLHVALHGSSRFQSDQQVFLEELHPTAQKFYRKFHQIKSDPVYSALNELLRSFRSPDGAKVYQKALAALQKEFGGNLELEHRLSCFHASLPPQQDYAFPPGLLMIWNPGRFAESLAQRGGGIGVCTRPEQLDSMLKNRKQLLILAELTWHQHKYSQFYGYDLARELIARKFEGNIVFASALPRAELKKTHISARLLAPIFPHIELPLDETHRAVFNYPPFSPVKWDYVRNYYLKRDGIVDKLIHDVEKILRGTDRKKIREVLEMVQAYGGILSPAVLAANNKALQIFENGPEERLPEQIRQLREMLQVYYSQIVAPEEPPVAQSHYRLMIVEDEPETLDNLKSGFGKYFRVEGFTCGAAAWEALKKRPRSYAALIVDMELLDEAQNWQLMQGFDLIEKAQMYPHLVIYMLTGFSRRALTYIQGSISTGKIRLQSKGKEMPLPPHTSYARLAAAILKQICINSRFLAGPQNGIWTNGLLLFYYGMRESPDWEPFWNEIVNHVEQFLEEGNNRSGKIPTTLFHVGLRDFTRDHLRRVLLHRLVVLYDQYSEQKVYFHRGIKKSIGFHQNSPRQYFTSLLGFSISTCREEPDAFIIQKRQLLPEEIGWLKDKFPNEPAVQYPHLFETFEEFREYLPSIVRNQMTELPPVMNDLQDCARILQILEKQVPQKLWDIALDLRCYRENYPGEFRRLAEAGEGQRLHAHISELVRQYPEDGIRRPLPA